MAVACCRVGGTDCSRAHMGPFEGGRHYLNYLHQRFSSLMFNSVTHSCPTFCYPTDCSTPGLPVHPNSQTLLKLMSIELEMPSNYLILYHPLLLLPSIFRSIRVFSSELAFRIRWPKYWSFNFSISLSNEYSGLISLRID